MKKMIQTRFMINTLLNECCYDANIPFVRKDCAKKPGITRGINYDKYGHRYLDSDNITFKTLFFTLLIPLNTFTTNTLTFPTPTVAPRLTYHTCIPQNNFKLTDFFQALRKC